MRDVTDDKAAELATAATRQIDFEDQQREAAGVDVGRYARFYSTGDDRNPEARNKREREERTRRTLWELMRDPDYARLYHKVGERLREAEQDADAALLLVETRLAEASRKIAVMEGDAARGPDGQPVFRRADGRAAYADGTDVPVEIAEGIIWPENAPSAEDYFAARDRQQQIEALLGDWNIYRNDVLGGIRDRFDTEDPAMSKSELQDALDEIESLAPSATQLMPTAPEGRQAVVTEPSAITIPTALR